MSTELGRGHLSALMSDNVAYALFIAAGLIGLILIPLGLPGLWLILLGIAGMGWHDDFGPPLEPLFIGIVAGIILLTEVIGSRFAKRSRTSIALKVSVGFVLFATALFALLVGIGRWQGS
nr:hypothetical protein [uncultured bacterium]